jgi:hypothetical protein
MQRFPVRIALVLAVLAGSAGAQDWQSVARTRHADYQAVDADGRSAYAGGFPIRLVGVVVNDTEDWLDPTPDYDSGVHLWQMGGQAEFYVQALTGSTIQAVGQEYHDPTDFGGTACWIGQNYGNHVKNQDPLFSYTDAEWTAELGRLGLYGGSGVSDPIRAGDLVEIRARAGLHYKGKMNVNEQHDKAAGKDFEIVRLAAGYGLPDATQLDLSELKDPADTWRFDPTRQTGPERYQSTRVELREVWIEDAADWAPGALLNVTDGVRTMPIRLGRDPAFAAADLPATLEPFHVTGILDQAAGDPVLATDGYQLLVMDPADVVAVPEPASLCLLGLAGPALLRRRRR